MKKLLALDVSSSTIGYAVFEYDPITAKLLDYGHLKPPSKIKSKGSLSARLDKTISLYLKLMDKHKPDEVAIEDYAKRFSQGRSTAQTIIMLACFNENICLTSYKYLNQKEVHRYPVVTIRSVLSKLFGQKIVSKDDIFPMITKQCSTFKTQNNKNGKVRTECWDQADAIACGMTHIIKTTGGVTNWLI